jgi:predicted dehydrogenase
MTDDRRRQDPTRREFLADTSRFTAASAAAVGLVPLVHPGGSETIQVALVGCGGRGSGAAKNALSVKRGPMKLVAMADIFPHRLASSHKALAGLGDRVDVPKERQFIGFDGYQQAIDCLSPGDVVIFATPPAFRWVHFSYAVEKGLHVFMEKPITVDGPTSKRMLALAEQATAKNLKVGVGLMSRHSRALQELAKRVHDGELGEIILQRGYRMQGPIVFFRSLPKPPEISDLLYQIQRFHSFLWASGGAFSDFYIHIIDQLCWMKGAWPVKAHALGGRHYRESEDGVTYVDQNFDTYSVEYTYADGTRFAFDGRCMTGCQSIFSSAMHGTKGSAVVSKSSDCGLPASIHKGQDLSIASRIWKSEVPPDQRNPYQNEWEDLVAAIRDDTPYNEAPRGIEASLVTSMGRMAAHTGVEVTFQGMLDSKHEFAPGVDKLTMESAAPLRADAKGRYPVPRPGIVKDREY